MKLVGVKYDQKLENTESKEFKDLAANLEATVSLTPKEDDSPIFVPFLSSALFVLNYSGQSITLCSLLSLRISYGYCLAAWRCFFLNAQKQLKAHLCGWSKTVYIPLVIPSTASPIIGGSGDVCSTT